MEDMVAKIVEMDKKARDMTAQAQQKKLDFENEVIAKRENMKNDYLERAKKRVAMNRQTAQKKADAALRQIEERDSAVIQRLESVYARDGDKWVDEIVARVVGE